MVSGGRFTILQERFFLGQSWPAFLRVRPQKQLLVGVTPDPSPQYHPPLPLHITAAIIVTS